MSKSIYCTKLLTLEDSAIYIQIDVCTDQLSEAKCTCIDDIFGIHSSYIALAKLFEICCLGLMCIAALGLGV